MPVSASFPVPPEHVFGVVTIKDACFCGEPARAVLPTLDDSGPKVFWLCERHGTEMQEGIAALEAEHGNPKTQAYAIVRTCGAFEGTRPCGAAASHIAVVGLRFDGEPILSVVSVCAKHGEQRP